MHLKKKMMINRKRKTNVKRNYLINLFSYTVNIFKLNLNKMSLK